MCFSFLKNFFTFLKKKLKDSFKIDSVTHRLTRPTQLGQVDNYDLDMVYIYGLAGLPYHSYE